jgi:hypothetical protein
LPINTSSEDIAVALQELGYEVISIKQMTAKRLSPEGEVTLVSLPLFLITLERNQKLLDMTGLSSAASEEEKVSVINQSVLSLLKRNSGNSS